MRIYMAHKSTKLYAFGEMTHDRKVDPMLIGEREEFVLRATKAGHSANEIAMDLRVNTRSIYRIRERLRQRGELT